jgi:hypothetical protein
MTLGLTVCSGCSGSGTDDPPGSSVCSPDLASIQEAIFARSCSQGGCHGPNEPAAGLDLTQADLAARLVEAAASTCERTLVVPAAPEQSFLFEKISAATPSCGQPMPPSGSLGAAEIECVRQWILGMEPGCETCGGAGCTDLQADPANCGDCGTVCPSGAACAAGMCQCAQGVACGGACADTTSDPQNCGDCGIACGPGQVCSLGACAGTCDPSLTQCGSSCVDTDSDPSNCGDCGVSCGVGGSCDAGTCSCAGGADTDTDPQNCGACGNVCAPGQSCVGGACTCANASVSFSAAVQPILTASCATNGCHRGMMPQAGMDLSAGKSYQAMVDVTAEQCNDGRKRVLPGQPSESYIMDKIQNVDLCFGTKMPKLSSLPAPDVEIISSWICAGAPNN